MNVLMKLPRKDLLAYKGKTNSFFYKIRIQFHWVVPYYVFFETIDIKNIQKMILPKTFYQQI